MLNEYCVTDMALESADGVDLSNYATQKKLSYGIEKRIVNIKSVELAKIIGKDRGVYITLDCKRSVLEGKTTMNYLSACISDCVRELVGILKKSSPILVVGLGNRNIVSDALGDKVVSQINVARAHDTTAKAKLCAISPGVLGTTGMQTSKIVSAIADKINPSVVILIDALATSCAKRLGCSFQISNSGISPGSGVGQEKERIDKSILGVPTICIGVPMMLSLRTSIYAFLKDYLQDEKIDINEFSLRQKMSEESLSNLVVAPKDVDYLVSLCSKTIANALNGAFA